MYSPIHQPIPAPSIVGGYTAIQQLYSYTAIQLYSAIHYTSYTPSLRFQAETGRGEHPASRRSGSLTYVDRHYPILFFARERQRGEPLGRARSGYVSSRGLQCTLSLVVNQHPKEKDPQPWPWPLKSSRDD